MRTINLLFLLLLGVCFSFAQERKNTVFGTISNDFGPLENVNIAVKGNEQLGTKSNKEGKYEITVEKGDVLVYSYTGMDTLEIIVEDVTRVLNIKMYPFIEKLENVTVTKWVRKTQDELKTAYFKGNPDVVKSSFGYLDKKTAAYQLRILSEDQISGGAFNIASLLRQMGISANCDRIDGILRIGRIRGSGPEISSSIMNLTGSVRSAPQQGMGRIIYDVDGMVMEDLLCDMIVPGNIKKIALMVSLNAVNKYGTTGPVVIINTKSGNPFPMENGKPVDLAKRRDNIFNEELQSIDNLVGVKSNILKQLEATTTQEELEKVIADNFSTIQLSYHNILDAYTFIRNEYPRSALASALISESTHLFEENPLALKALAYLYEAYDNNQEAHNLYKKIFKLRPNYAQSYMDLANSYRNIGDHKSAADYYMRYNTLIEDEMLAKSKSFYPIIQKEFHNLVAVEEMKGIASKLTQFKSKGKDTGGTRLVFEWNDGEAEFALQVVTPTKNFELWEHTHQNMAAEINEEKRQGYSSKEFFLDNDLPGEWMINAEYFGNKSTTPTYLKVSMYHNWGEQNQRKEVQVFKLQLKEVNKHLLKVPVSSNSKGLAYN